jgi:serine/threonine protein kinase
MVGKQIGIGSHGVVFRAVHKDRPEAGSYALKVARKAGDERFTREAHLLSRIHHPSVPRLETSGRWRSHDGEDYPYLVMQWVEGISLYAWALEHGITLRQVLGQLAQAARALEAVHQKGVHRDVKGGNIRVSDEGHAVLLDFGSCWYPGAPPLTGNALPPVTPPYRSPQQVMFGYALERGWQGVYKAPPADDLYALGVTAYRLLTGRYPPSLSDFDGSTQVVPLEAPRGLNDVCPELGELIVRLLSEDPKARGSARGVAEELEALREYSRSALDDPWIADASRQPTAKLKPPAHHPPAPPPAPREPARPPVAREDTAREWVPRLVLAGSVLVLALLGLLLPSDVGQREVASTEPASQASIPEQPDAGTTVGEEGVASVSSAETRPVSEGKVSRKMPNKPEPGQRRPPCTPKEAVVEINGGCWVPGGGAKPPCEDGWYEHNGRCYFPMPGQGRIPTSEEPP